MALLALVVLVVAAGVAQMLRGIPAVRVTPALASTTKMPGTPVSLPWPSQGESALAVGGGGLVGTSGPATSVPIASITKVVTALVILHDHPLAAGASGPSITFSAADAALYRQEASQQDSVLPVAAGETLSELQALEGLLIPSADNLAVDLARWDAGTRAAFVAKMNAYVAGLGLLHTHFTDPSGLSPGSVSNAADLVRLGEIAMRNATIASISAMPQVTLPLAGTVYNYDYDLGKSGIIGIKTGSDAQAGGCFLFAAKATVAGARRTVYGAVLGQQSGSSPLQKALNAALPLVAAAPSTLEHAVVLPAGTTVGMARAAWQAPVALRTTATVRLLGSPGETAHLRFVPSTLGNAAPGGARAGNVTVSMGSQRVRVPVVSAGAISAPTLLWRLERR